MFTRSETPQQQTIREHLKKLKRQVEARASQVLINERFYLDALANVLDKTDEHAATFLTQIPSFRIEGMLQSMSKNYELVHLEHELRHSFLTGLKKGEPLTQQAIARFYRSSVRRHEMSCLYAIVLYSDRLYRYDHRNPTGPVLIEPIVLMPAPQPPNIETEVQRNARLKQDRTYQQSYQTLKAKIAGLAKNRIHLANELDRKSMVSMLLPNVIENDSWCETNFDMVAALLPHFVTLIEDIANDYRQAKKSMIGNAASGALFIIGGLAAPIAVVCLTHYLLGVTIPMAKVIVMMKLTLILGVAFVALGLSAALYFWYQEQHYRYIAQDIAQVNYSKSYRDNQGQLLPNSPLQVDKSLATFFTDHGQILEAAFPAP